MRTMRSSLSLTRTIRARWSLSIIDGSWMLCASVSRQCGSAFIVSGSTVKHINVPIFIMHCSGTRHVDVRLGGRGTLGAVHLVICSKRFGEKVSSIPNRLKWVPLDTSLDM